MRAIRPLPSLPLSLPAGEKPARHLRSFDLTPEAIVALKSLSQEATDYIGRAVSTARLTLFQLLISCCVHSSRRGPRPFHTLRLSFRR
jgi:hypothetical protein